MEKLKYALGIIGMITLGIALIIAVVSLIAFVFMLGWNIVADYFEFKKITFAVSFGIIMMVSAISSFFGRSNK